jgi:hypothetical protein
MIVDIDFETNTATLHHPTCASLPEPIGTAAKPFAMLGEAGGWYPVANEEHAQEHADTLLPGVRVTRCAPCDEAGLLHPIFR